MTQVEALDIAIACMKTAKVREAKLKALAERCVELEVEAAKAHIPEGHCPYAYYEEINKAEDRNCNSVTCGDCMEDFAEKLENQMRVKYTAFLNGDETKL